MKEKRQRHTKVTEYMENKGKGRMLLALLCFKTKARMRCKKQNDKTCTSVSGSHLGYFKSRKGPQKVSHQTKALRIL